MNGVRSRAPGRPSPAAARLALSALAALVAVGILAPAAPPPAGLDAPPARFSAARAMALVEALASTPHPLDSDAGDRVREGIEARLDELGIPWEREAWSRRVAIGRDRPGVPAEGINLLARLVPEGAPADGPVVLFVAHHDSRPGPLPADALAGSPTTLRELDRTRGGAPGAGDDGAAVAAFLEALRALKAGPPLANELWFLFTDGEEYGLLGAQAFASDPGRLERVVGVMNFEGRGNGGPVVLFQTGHDDRAWVSAYARTVRWPEASSLGPTAYELLPNDTDFSVFLRAGLPGLNFAFIGGGSAYHRPWDTPQNLDRRTLQHHGEIVLGLARELGGADLEALAGKRGAASFFTLPGNLLVRYPRAWEPVLALVALIATAGALTFGLRAGALRGRGVLLATLAWPVVSLVCAALVVTLAWGVGRATTAILGGLGLLPAPDPRGNLLSGGLATLGAVATVAFVATLLVARARRAWSETLAAGTLVGWTGLALLVAFLAPGAAHVLTWPAFFAALGLHAALRARVLEVTGPSAWLWPLLACVPGLLLLLPVEALFGQVGSVAPLGPVIVASVPAALGLGLFVPALEPCVAATPRLARLAAGVVTIGCLAASAVLAAVGL